ARADRAGVVRGRALERRRRVSASGDVAGHPRLDHGQGRGPAPQPALHRRRAADASLPRRRRRQALRLPGRPPGLLLVAAEKSEPSLRRQRCRAKGASKRLRAHRAQHRGLRAGLGPTRGRGDLADAASPGDRRDRRIGSQAARDGRPAARAQSGHGAPGALVVLALRLGHRHRGTAGPSGVPGRGHARDRQLARGRPQPRAHDRELAVARPHLRGVVAQSVAGHLADRHAGACPRGRQAARRILFGLLASRPAPAAAAQGAGARLTGRRSTKGGTDMTTTFTDESIMLALAALTYRGFQDALEGPAHERIVSGAVLGGLSTLPSVKDQWELVWGPATDRDRGLAIDTNMMYVVRSRSAPSRLVVAIRGTNP